MSEVGPSDRAAVEAAYPDSAFEDDLARNAAGNAQVHHGLRIEPAAEGRFRLIRAARHTGESGAPEASLFLAPDGQHRYASLSQGAAQGEPVETGDELGAARRRADDYAAFIDRILEVLRTHPFPPPIGRGEERLKGFRGG